MYQVDDNDVDESQRASVDNYTGIAIKVGKCSIVTQHSSIPVGLFQLQG